MWGRKPVGTVVILQPPIPGPTNFRKSSLNLSVSRLQHLPLGFMSCICVMSASLGFLVRTLGGKEKGREPQTCSIHTSCQAWGWWLHPVLSFHPRSSPGVTKEESEAQRDIKQPA